jgi:uncharacterized protein YcfJ
MTPFQSTAVMLAALTMAGAASAQLTLYRDDGYSGRAVTTQRAVPNFRDSGFNDRASSAVVVGQRWEVCEDMAFGGRCVVLRQGNYPSLSAMGLNDRLSSARPLGDRARVDDDRYAPQPVVRQDWRQRRGERLFEADVTSVRVVMGQRGAPEQRCWLEREEVRGERGEANVPGAVIGAVIGGILGHQVGNGNGRDVATVGAAVIGGAVGSQVGRDGYQTTHRNVQRCEQTADNRRPEYWDVSYRFRGQDHRVQMSRPPGQTVTVNRNGEPRAQG